MIGARKETPLRKRKASSAFILTLCALGGLIGPTVATAQEMEWATTELAEGVFQFSYGAYNTLFVVTDDGVVAFDPISDDAARILAQEIRSAAPGVPLMAIVYSHHHADHTSGAGVLRTIFGGRTLIIGHENGLAPLLEAANPSVPPPDVTFSGRLTLRPGGREIRLVYLGPSHTASMIVGLIPDARIAFAVDFVSNDRVGYRDLSSHQFREFFQALESLEKLDFERIAFGHGPIGDRDAVSRQIAYYGDLRDAVQEALDAGWSEDEAAERISLDEYASWGGYEEWFALNVRGLYRWLASER
jgi:glyoxylase-like metal-dependent hydrolase (beta-lactamase superfamily II)